MNRRYASTAAIATAAFLLSACTSDPNPGKASTPTATTADSSSAATLPHNGAPKVQNPLPAKVLSSNPCDAALTSAQIVDFIGEPDPAKGDDSALGPLCHWDNAAGTGAGITVAYQTKSSDGISLTYSSVKTNAARWEVPAPVQSYPAVAYVPDGINPADKSNCVVVVGVSDQLAYSVALTLGDDATAAKIDGCTAARDVADTVMTNIKTRA